MKVSLRGRSIVFDDEALKAIGGGKRAKREAVETWIITVVEERLPQTIEVQKAWEAQQLRNEAAERIKQAEEIEATLADGRAR